MEENIFQPSEMIFLEIFYFYINVYVHVLLCNVCPQVPRGQMRALYPLELGLQAAVNKWPSVGWEQSWAIWKSRTFSERLSHLVSPFCLFQNCKIETIEQGCSVAEELILFIHSFKIFSSILTL